ncbi:unnamed protein product [Closterium sp. NIES-65]|nr:unnamed protein product [Closterium sp. NIES-65]
MPATTDPNPPFNPAQLQALLALLQQHAPATAGISKNKDVTTSAKYDKKIEEFPAVAPRPPKTARIEKDLASAPVENDNDESDDADGGGNAATPLLPIPPPTAPLAASPRSALPTAAGSREAGRAHTTGASSKSPRASRAARRELEAHQEPRQEEEAGREVLSAPMGAADRGAKEIDEAEIGQAAAVLPRMAAAGKSVAVDAVVPAAERAAVQVSAGVSAAVFDADSVSPSATPRVAQVEAEGTRLGADPEQTAEVALSASPTPVTPVVSATTGEQGDAPMAEGAMTAGACAGMPAAAAAASRQEHGQAVGEFPGPANGDSSGAARSKLKKKLRAQPAPRRPGAGLGPGSPGPLRGWLLQGQPPSE